MTPVREEPRHIVITSIPFEQLLDFLTGRRVLRLPEGTELKSWWKECEWWEGIESARLVCLKLEHPSFPVAEAGRLIPRVEVPQARVKMLQPAEPKAISRAKVLSRKVTRSRKIVVEETIST
jgi:hypothetical protein